jgi:uroporphyrinogen decarboxylase
MTSLMVRNIPTICIDGQIRFVSRIPAKDELIKAVQERILQKMRVKIAQRRGRIYLLCSPDSCGQDQVERLQAKVEKAVAELGVEIDVKLISDDTEIMAFGVLPQQTPVVVSAKYRVRSSRVLPEPAVIKEWIKDIL